MTKMTMQQRMTGTTNASAAGNLSVTAPTGMTTTRTMMMMTEADAKTVTGSQSCRTSSSSALNDANQKEQQNQLVNQKLNQQMHQTLQLHDRNEGIINGKSREQHSNDMTISNDLISSSSIKSNCNSIPSITSCCNINNNNNNNIHTISSKYNNMLYQVSCKVNAQPGTFHARDNVCNFITWCRSLQIRECLLFETEDLVLGKNEKSFILCLLEVARKGSMLGMEIPLLIQLEQEIDQEIESENQKSLLQVNEEEQRQPENENHESSHHRPDVPFILSKNKSFTRIPILKSASGSRISPDYYDDTDAKHVIADQNDSQYNSETDSDTSSNFAIQPQIVTNDLKSLHEHVVDLLNRCTCPSQYPMIKVSDGRYRIGDTKTMIFVRFLRKHVMVRVGGGWDTLGKTIL
jgi:hypothetical protein